MRERVIGRDDGEVVCKRCSIAHGFVSRLRGLGAARVGPAVAVALGCLVPATAPTAAAATPKPPSPRAIAKVMRRTVEADDHREHFALGKKPLLLVTSDGGHGVLTAALGTRTPTADGYGQLVFFWHDGAFVGWDARYEATAITSITAPRPGVVRVGFAHYRAKDPLCCPSLKPISVIFTWTGSKLRANRTVPAPPKGHRVAVRLLK